MIFRNVLSIYPINIDSMCEINKIPGRDSKCGKQFTIRRVGVDGAIHRVQVMIISVM